MKLPAEQPPSGDGIPGPITAIRSAGGSWQGAGAWATMLPLARLTSTVLGDGTLFGRVKLRFEFAATPNQPSREERSHLAERLTLARHGTSTGAPSPTNFFSEFIITVAPDQPLVWIEEHHAMLEGDLWHFDLARGWQPRRAFFSRRDRKSVV